MLESVVITVDYIWFIEMPYQILTRDLCEKVVEEEVDMSEYVSDQFKTKEMCERVVEIGLTWVFDFVPEQLRTRALCVKVVGRNMVFQFNSKRN